MPSKRRLIIAFCLTGVAIGGCSRDSGNGPSPRIFFRREIEVGRIANAEITKREGWSGKVRLLARADEAPLAWVVWVERKAGNDGSKREIRFLRIDDKTDKILDYKSAESLPDSAWGDDVVLQ